MLKIAAESPVTTEGRLLIEGSEAALREHYPPDACFSFSPEELNGSDSTFLVARELGEPVGCVALVDCGSYGEIKRLYVRQEWRGRGIAEALMDRLEADAGDLGLNFVRLETGSRLAAAVRLYERRGYNRRGSFGCYLDHPASLFMEKRLD